MDAETKQTQTPKEEIPSTTETIVEPDFSKEQVLQFVDSDDVTKVKVPVMPDPTANLENFVDATLDEFFSRPVKIHEGSWIVGAHYDVTFDPWQLYFNTLSVKRKLDNYHMMRCKLNVKVFINGSPFHYSRLLVNYQPMYGFNTNHDPDVSSTRALKIMKSSMLPNVMMDPSVQAPGQFELPFPYFENYITTEDMVNGSETLGRIRTYSTVELRAANDTAVLAVPVVFMAWASDVKLVIPTNAIVSASGLKKRKKKKKKLPSRPDSVLAYGQRTIDLFPDPDPEDEQENGLLSNISTVVANASGALKDVPIIGGYAGTAQKVANAATKVFRYFGWGRPILRADPTYVKRKPFTPFAITQGLDTVDKLSIDPEQKVTLDPRVSAAVGIDEMNLLNMAQKEALVSTVEWSSLDSVDTELFWMNVTPTITRQATIAGGKEFLQSPLAMVARPFQYWTGTIDVRFEFVGSKFHTGRLRLSFEPDSEDFSPDNVNTTYSAIIDLTHLKDHTFSIPWSQTLPYKEVFPTVRNELFIPPAGIKNYSRVHSNGRIFLTVLTPLISSDSTKDASINIYVSAGEDFRVQAPNKRFDTSLNQDFMMPVAASGIPEDIEIVACSSENPALDTGGSSILFGDVCSDRNQATTDAVFFGEQILSFRALLKRYQYANTINHTRTITAESAALTRYTVPRYPPRKGYYSPGTVAVQCYGVGTTDGGITTAPYNFNDSLLYHYVSSAFLSQRGSVRYKILGLSGNDYGLITAIRRGETVIDDITSVDGIQVAITRTNIEMNSIYNNQIDSLWTGASLQPSGRQPAHEVELPYYNPRRFTTTDIDIIGSNKGTAPMTSDAFMVTIEALKTGAYNTRLGLYFSTGEDFDLNTFLGPPLTYVLDTQYSPAV